MNNKQSIEELYHFGIPGMKWGRRKASALNGRIRKVTNTHPSYSQKDVIRDRKLYGEIGVASINRKLHKGVSLKKARKQELIKQALIGAAATGAAGYAGRKLGKKLGSRQTRRPALPYVTGNIIDI